jgi:nicotinate dehydrogenase subunit A
VSERFELTVNGQDVEVRTHPDTSLLHVLRNELGLMGTRFGCGMGLCGACFVNVDGTVVPACDTPVWSVRGTRVTTVEGLSEGGRLHRVQQAVLDEQAAQCGFCISGVLVRAAALLEEEPAPTPARVAEALDRNLCRCGVQGRIVKAVVRAAGGAPTEEAAS